MSYFKQENLIEILDVPIINNLLNPVGSIFNGIEIPDKFAGDAYINFYLAKPVNFAVAHELEYSILCCAKTEKKAFAISSEIITRANRVQYSTFGVLISYVTTIQPENKTDFFRVVLACTIKPLN